MQRICTSTARAVSSANHDAQLRLVRGMSILNPGPVLALVIYLGYRRSPCIEGAALYKATRQCRERGTLGRTSGCATPARLTTPKVPTTKSKRTGYMHHTLLPVIYFSPSMQSLSFSHLLVSYSYSFPFFSVYPFQ